jgi:hypothetical protein
MLPTLVGPGLGGSEATSLIGSYLRTHGVQALIYPSARFNTWVQVQDGVPVDYGGWNLVDYRNAPCSQLPAFDPGLFRPEPGNTTVELPPKGSRRFGHGSWKLRRVMEKAEMRHRTELKRYLESRATGTARDDKPGPSRAGTRVLPVQHRQRRDGQALHRQLRAW